MSQRMNRRHGAWRIRFGVAGQRRRNHRLWRGWRLAADEGAVTAEFAVVLPAVILVAVVLIALARTVTVSMSCQDAAAVAVREIVVAGDESDPVGAAQAVADAIAEQSPESLEIISRYMADAAELGSKDAIDWLKEYYNGDDGRYDAYV